MDKLTQEAKQLAKGVNNDTKHKLNSNKGVITNKFEKLKQLYNEIINLSKDEEEITNIMVANTEFEVEVQETLSVIEDVLKDKFRVLSIDDPMHIERRFNQSDMSAGVSSQRKTVKLPSIEIPKFSGELTEWPTFLDLFEAVIDTCSDLDDVQKFTYLRGYLQGPALQAINGLTLTNSDYTETLKILKDRFGNVQQIVSSHVERLANLPNILSDSNLTEIRKCYVEIESHVGCLDSLNVKSDSYSALLVPMIMGKLPPQLKLAVSRNLRSKLWSLAALLNLINTEIKARANCGECNFSQGNEFDHLDLRTTSVLAFQASKSISNQCVFCLGQHWSDKCDV